MSLRNNAGRIGGLFCMSVGFVMIGAVFIAGPMTVIPATVLLVLGAMIGYASEGDIVGSSRPDELANRHSSSM